MLLGLTSGGARERLSAVAHCRRAYDERTAVHDLVNLVQVRQARDNCERDLAHDGFWDGADTPVDAVERPVRGWLIVSQT